MKKQKIVLTGLVGFAFLFGCSQVDTVNEVNAGSNMPNGYILVSENEVRHDEIMEIKHIQTGCHYTYVKRGQGITFNQMFIEKDGVSVPYCDKVVNK